jgi:hypothetical protein
MLGRIANLARAGFWAGSTPNVSTVTPAGNSQATAASVGDADVVVTSGGTATSADGIRLPKAQKGDVVFVRHPGAYTLDVWPAVGDSINGASADAVFTGVTTGKCCLLVAVANGAWAAMVG